MNIISGKAKGIRLEVPKGLSIRPTSIMARKSIFDSIRNFQNMTVVDLFAGTGALGLEAASRGASRVFFFETSRPHSEILKINIEKVIKAGVSSELRLQRTDALKAHENLPEINGKVDLIFADPPYNQSAGALEILLTDESFAKWAGDALLVFETPAELSRKPRLEDISLWSIKNKRNFGQTLFLFFKTMKNS